MDLKVYCPHNRHLPRPANKYTFMSHGDRFSMMCPTKYLDEHLKHRIMSSKFFKSKEKPLRKQETPRPGGLAHVKPQAPQLPLTQT